MLNIWNVLVIWFVCVDLNIFFKSHQAEDVNLERDLILDEPLGSVSNSDDIAILDEFGSISLEECFGRSSLVCDNAVDHGNFETFFGLDGLVLSRGDFRVDVESTAVSLKILNFNESRFSQFFFLSHMLNSKIMSIIFDYFNDFLEQSLLQPLPVLQQLLSPAFIIR